MSDGTSFGDEKAIASVACILKSISLGSCIEEVNDILAGCAQHGHSRVINVNEFSANQEMEIDTLFFHSLA